MPTSDGSPHREESTRLFELWCKYEDVTMHFNDLIIRLRFQALAGVAGISAVVSVFGHGGLESKVVGGFFVLLIFFWVAIWLLDRRYYDRLLSGAVAALLRIERHTRDAPNTSIDIDLSTTFEKSFRGAPLALRKVAWLKDGRNLFYLVVLLALIAGAFVEFFH